MKKLLLFLFIGITANVAQAQQELTLEDAVMQQYRKFYPESTNMVQWIPGTDNYSFLSADYQTLLKGNAKNDKTSTIITTAELATMTGRQPRYVNVAEWVDENSFYTTIGEQYLSLIHI